MNEQIMPLGDFLLLATGAVLVIIFIGSLVHYLYGEWEWRKFTRENEETE